MCNTIISPSKISVYLGIFGLEKFILVRRREVFVCLFVCSINPLGIRGSSSRQLSISVTRSRRLRAFLDHFCAYVKSTGVGVREVPNETVGGLAEIFFFF